MSAPSTNYQWMYCMLLDEIHAKLQVESKEVILAWIEKKQLEEIEENLKPLFKRGGDEREL